MDKTEEEEEQQAFALAEMQRYCEEHPTSPSALRRPKLILRGRSWVALHGYTMQDGIAGIGGTVTAALRAFDAQCVNKLEPPNE